MENLTETYKFDDDNRAINIYKYDLPQPWINYLSNGTLHAFVSQAGGGFLWWKSATQYRITRYRAYNLPIDSPGFYVYIRMKDGTVWSPAFRPCNTPVDSWCAVHQPGITSFMAEKAGIKAMLSLFIPPDYDMLVWDLKLTNTAGETEELDVFAYMEYSQLVWKEELFSGYYWRHMLKTWFDEDLDALLYLCHFQYHPNVEQVPLVYFASTEKMDSYCGSRDAFMGAYRDERNPESVEKGCCKNESISAGEPCGALHKHIVLEAGKERQISFFTGVASGALTEFEAARTKARNDLEAIKTPGEINRQREKLKNRFEEHFSLYSCQLPDRDVERQINTWSPLNCIHTARYSRGVNTNAPGVRGTGFRDTCQDMLAIAYRKPEWAAETLKELLSKQYADGHTVHSIPYDRKEKPDTNTHSDNHLWLPFLVYAIISETGKGDLLEEQVPFLEEDHITAGALASVWEHLLAAVSFTETHLGSHGLPLTLKGDWNDIIGKFSREGRGESVFAAQQYVVALKYLTELADYTGKMKDASWLADCRSRQEAAIKSCAWDGRWWLRGFDDDGNPVGSETSRFGKLFINPQSWAVLSGAGEKAMLKQAMEEVAGQLDTGIGLKKLTPGFKTWPEVSDPFTGYGPGCGENGAIFCQANTWAIIAEAMLGNGTRAWKYFTQLIPHLALQKVGLEAYKAEPYAWVSNIVGPENKHFGWANVNQITGTAAWMDVAATQYLLGIRPELKGLRIDPCIPKTWEKFSVSRYYRGTRLEITIMNPDNREKGIKSLSVDGAETEGTDPSFLPSEMLKGKDMVNILVVMG